VISTSRKRASEDAQYECVDLDFGTLEYSYESEEGKYKSTDLVHPNIWRIGCEHISRATEELEEEQSDTEQCKSNISNESIGNADGFHYLVYEEYATDTDEYVYDREGEPSTPDWDDTVLIGIEQ
jgi:hypothetical protein